MTLSMYQASLPVFIHGLKNLSALLTKAEAHLAAKKIDPAVIVNARLYPDMLPFARQIQITSDSVKGFAARVAGVEVPSFADTETTLPELQERISKTIAFLESFKPEQIDGTEAKKIALKVGGKELTFDGQFYLTHFVTPNFYFHISIAYALLRENGIEIGKQDYLGLAR